MFAPQIKNLSSFAHRDESESAFDDPSYRKLAELFKIAIFFLFLRRLGLPMVVYDIPPLLSRFHGTDKSGIVPDDIILRYCESRSPDVPPPTS